jgi:hypothetical protein
VCPDPEFPSDPIACPSTTSLESGQKALKLTCRFVPNNNIFPLFATRGSKIDLKLLDRVGH